jgi:hypothetical protein
MAARQQWCRVTIIGRDGTVLAGGVLAGPGVPDIAAVDDIARLALVARRLGASITVTELSDALRELLAISGLPVDVERKTERREEPFGVQEGEEEAHPGDLAG